MIVPETRYMRLDPRQLDKFMRVPGFTGSLSTEELQGMERRMLTRRWTPDERIVYHAIKEGYTSMDSLPVATGLMTQQIQDALAKLTARGDVSAIK